MLRRLSVRAAARGNLRGRNFGTAISGQPSKRGGRFGPQFRDSHQDRNFGTAIKATPISGQPSKRAAVSGRTFRDSQEFQTAISAQTAISGQAPKGVPMHSRVFRDRHAIDRDSAATFLDDVSGHARKERADASARAPRLVPPRPRGNALGEVMRATSPSRPARPSGGLCCSPVPARPRAGAC